MNPYRELPEDMPKNVIRFSHEDIKRALINYAQDEFGYDGWTAKLSVSADQAPGGYTVYNVTGEVERDMDDD